MFRKFFLKFHVQHLLALRNQNFAVQGFLGLIQNRFWEICAETAPSYYLAQSSCGHNIHSKGQRLLWEKWNDCEFVVFFSR